MYCRLTLFKLELKKFVGMLPRIFLETILFGLIAAGIGLYASKAVYADKVIGQIKAGVVADSKEPVTKMLVQFVQSMDSLKDTVSLELLSEEEARKQLESGEIYGAVMIPEGMVDSILSGENIPATILFGSGYNQAETLVFAQAAQTGAKLLTVAQAGIYAADTFCIERGMQDYIQQTEDYLNEAYLEYALGRASVFHREEVTALKGTAPSDYYGIALIFVFLSFAGLSFGRYVQVKVCERKKMLCLRGIFIGEQYLIETGAFALVFSFLGMLVSLPVFFLLSYSGDSTFQAAGTWVFLMLIWFVLGCFLKMLVQIMGNSAGGIGVCFVLLLVCMFVSGTFLPPAFLPVWMEWAGNSLFYRGWMEKTGMLLQGRLDSTVILKLLMQLLLFLAAGVLAAKVRKDTAK